MRRSSGSGKVGRPVLGLAGLSLAFSGLGPGLGRLLRRRYGPFVRRSAGSGFTAEVSGRSGGGSSFKPVVQRAGGSLRLRRGDFDCVFPAGPGAGRLAITPRPQSVDAFLRAFFSSQLNVSGGALVHACGLAAGGRAHVFIGRSGAGKSTLARLAAGAGIEVISDEIVPLRRERGRFYVYGSPFWGEMRSAGRPLRLPLGGIYALRKGRRNLLRPGSAAGFMPLFLRCCLNFSREPAAAAGLLATAAPANRLYKGELAFHKKDASFLRLLK